MSQKFTFTAKGVDLSVAGNFQRIKAPYDTSPGPGQGAQSLVTFAQSASATGVITLQLALVEVDAAGAFVGCVARFHGTATIGADRNGADGASGNYLAPVAWAFSGTRFIDLAGADYTGDREVGKSAGFEWWLGLEDVTTAAITDITVRVQALRLI